MNTLFDQIKTPTEVRFEEFNRKNPQVYILFKQFTFQVIRRGFRRYSADAIMHRVRWESNVETSGDDGFKVNNNYVRLYAEKFVSEHPQHRDIFEFRKREANHGETEV